MPTTSNHNLQESPANARVTRDSSACKKTPHGRKLSSAGNHTLTLNITSIGKPVAKLWPFLYTHVSEMAVSRHLGFLKFERCTIRSADPENLTLEPNIT